jgi:glutamine synthetase type III
MALRDLGKIVQFGNVAWETWTKFKNKERGLGNL